jgi:anti-sigma B factor antagonist
MSADLPENGSTGSGDRDLARWGFAVERHDVADGPTRLACVGELDLATLPVFEDALCRAETDARAIILDLSELDFIDSRGLAMILALDRRLRESGGRLTIVRGPDAVNHIFEVTGVLDRLEFVDSPVASHRAPNPTGEHTSTRGAVSSAAPD